MPPLLRLSGKQILVIGFCMVLFGFIMPWLMILGRIETTFFLAFLTYGVSLTGMILGVVGAAMLGLQRRKKDKDER
jgi:putative Mn2+ efflux pump MntP